MRCRTQWIIALIGLVITDQANCQATPDEPVVEEEVEETTKPILTGIPQIDYIHDPNLPIQVSKYDLSDYPFYSRLPEDLLLASFNFTCDNRLDGFYASVPHKCQVYHNCLFGQRYDFLCANYTVFDQKNFICHYASEVDCANSADHFDRNNELYVTTTTTTERPPQPQIIYVDRPRPERQRPQRPRPQRPFGRPGNRRTSSTTEAPAYDDYYYDYYNDQYYDYSNDEPTTTTTSTQRPRRPNRPLRKRVPGGNNRPRQSENSEREETVVDQNASSGSRGNRPGRKPRPEARPPKKTTTSTTTTESVPEQDYYADYEYYDYADETPTTTTVAPARPSRPSLTRRQPGGNQRRAQNRPSRTTESPSTTTTAEPQISQAPRNRPVRPGRGNVRNRQDSNRRPEPIKDAQPLDEPQESVPTQDTAGSNRQQPARLRPQFPRRRTEVVEEDATFVENEPFNQDLENATDIAPLDNADSTGSGSQVQIKRIGQNEPTRRRIVQRPRQRTPVPTSDYYDDY